MNKFNRLYVYFTNPNTQVASWIGILALYNGVYVFTYSELAQFKTIQGFGTITDFPDLDTTYRFDSLPPLFQNKIIPRSRADYPEWCERFGLIPFQHTDMEWLAATKGKTNRDPFTLRAI
jgi:hypothetical protein